MATKIYKKGVNVVIVEDGEIPRYIPTAHTRFSIKDGVVIVTDMKTRSADTNDTFGNVQDESGTQIGTTEQEIVDYLSEFVGSFKGGGVEGAISGPQNRLINFVADDYDDITTVVAPTANDGDIAYLENSQGTQWLPGTLGGSYYPKGFYVYDSVDGWVSDRNAIAAQLEMSVDSIAVLNNDISNINSQLLLKADISLLESLTYESYIFSNTPLMNQSTTFEPYFIQDIHNNLTNGIWTWLAPDDGDYEVFIDYRYSINNTTVNFQSHVLVNGSVFEMPLHIESKDSGGPGISVNVVSGGVVAGTLNTGTDQYLKASGKRILNNISQGDSYNFKFEFNAQNNNLEPTIYNAILGVRRAENRN